jgi:hypothetical protein
MSDHSKQLIESVAKGNDAFAMVKSVVAEIEASEAPIDLTDEFPEDKLGKDWVFGEEPMDIEVDYLRYHPEWRRFKSSGSQGDRRVVARFHISADGEEYDDDDEIVSVPRYKVFMAWWQSEPSTKPVTRCWFTTRLTLLRSLRASLAYSRTCYASSKRSTET